MRKVNLLLCVLFLSACAVAQTATPGPEITVRRLSLNAVANRLPPRDQQQIIEHIQGHTYQSDNLENVLAEIANRVRYGLQTHGFFKADVVRRSYTMVSETAQGQVVDVSLSVNEGEQYRLKEISFADERAVSAAELRAVFPIGGGDIFDVEKIRHGLDVLRKVYENKGYINSTPVPNTDVDDAARAISLLVDIDEGVQYRIGALVLNGAETTPGAGAKLLENWKQYEGQIYTPRSPEQFLRENAALLPPEVTGNNNLVITQDPHQHVLNFRLDLADPAKGNR